jgi:hypothetical protein
MENKMYSLNKLEIRSISGGITQLKPDGSIVVTGESKFKLNDMIFYPDQICVPGDCSNDMFDGTVGYNLSFVYNGKTSMSVTAKEISGGAQYFIS